MKTPGKYEINVLLGAATLRRCWFWRASAPHYYPALGLCQACRAGARLAAEAGMKGTGLEDAENLVQSYESTGCEIDSVVCDWSGDVTRPEAAQRDAHFDGGKPWSLLYGLR